MEPEGGAAMTLCDDVRDEPPLTRERKARAVPHFQPTGKAHVADW